MKYYFNKIFGLATVAASLLLLGSCLKNNDYYVDFSKGEPSVELPMAAKYSNIPYGIDWSPDTITPYKIAVNIASVNKLNKDVTSTLDIDKDWVDQYNTQQDAAAKEAQQEYLEDPSHAETDPNFPYSWTPMEILPDSLYEIAVDGKAAQFPFDMTVPANERVAYADVNIFTDKFPDGHNYVLPFTITKSGINISSWNHQGLWFISSPFAGTFTNFHAHTVGGGYDETYDDVMTLNTVDQHTVSEPASIADFFGGYTEYHFLGDGSVEVEAGASSSTPDSYGAEVLESSSDPETGEFHVKFTILAGKYTMEVWFER